MHALDWLVSVAREEPEEAELSVQHPSGAGHTRAGQIGSLQAGARGPAGLNRLGGVAFGQEGEGTARLKAGDAHGLDGKLRTAV